MDDPRFSVVVVTYNSSEFVENCLEPIYGVPTIEIIVVDNCSTDGTPKRIQEKFPEVILIRSPSNLGFAAGNNLAFQRCLADTVLLLNPDAFLDDVSQIEAMRDALWASPKTAFVGPQLLNSDGRHQVGDAGYADSLTALCGHFLFLHKLFPTIPAIYLTNRKLLAADAVVVDWISGACLMTRKAVIDDIGGLDSSIFMYGEDVEWGERAKAKSYSAIYLPQIRVRHLQGAMKADGTVNVSNNWLSHRARKFLARGRLQHAAFRAIAILGLGIRYLFYALKSLTTPRSDAWTKRKLVGKLLKVLIIGKLYKAVI